MIELIGCIIACTLLVIGFKIFDRLKISTLQAIVINYLVAAGIGAFYIPGALKITDHIHSPWFISGCIIGIIFMLNFLLLSLSVRKIGASVTSVAGKMSLVITILFGIIILKESSGILKIAGIITALISIFLITRIKTDNLDKRFLFLPLILFVAGGFIDISLNYNQQKFLKENESGLFTMLTFCAAFIIGLIILIIQLTRGKEKLSVKNVVAGVILGIINWFSIYLLLLALKSSGFESSEVYPVLNIGIMLLTVLTGVIGFKEKLSMKQWMGMILAVAAIILISFS